MVRLERLKAALIVISILFGFFVILLLVATYGQSYAIKNANTSAPQMTQQTTPDPPQEYKKTYVSPDGYELSITSNVPPTTEVEWGYVNTIKSGNVRDNADGSRTYYDSKNTLNVTRNHEMDVVTERQKMINAITSGVSK